MITREEPVREEVFGEFARIQAAEKAAATTVTMLALVNRAQARVALAAPPQPTAETETLTPVVEMTELPQEPASATSLELTDDAPKAETPPISIPTALSVAAGKNPEPEAEPGFPL